MLDEQPRGDQSQAAVLPIEPIVVGVEGKMVQIKEPEPMPLTRIGVATDGIILVSQPHNEDDVKRSRGVIEEL